MSDEPISATMAAMAALGPMLSGALGSAGAAGSGFLSSLLPAAAGAAGAGSAAAMPSLASLMGSLGLEGGANMLGPITAAAGSGSLPSLASTLGAKAGTGLLNLGEKILPNVASSAITNAMTPTPSMPSSYTAPEMPSASGGRMGGMPGQERMSNQQVLSMLLSDLMPQQNDRQMYGGRRF